MPKDFGDLIRRSQLQIMAHLCEMGECTIREYMKAKGLSESQVPFVTIGNDFRALRESGLVEMEKRGSVAIYRATVSASQFRRWCARYIIENAFGGSVEGLLDALDELTTAKKKSA